MTKKRLVVNADDYGLTAGVSDGIRKAHLNGIVSSATAMMNMPGADKDLIVARALCPNLGLGVHLMLTAGTPLLPTRLIPSLIDEEGHFFSLSEYIPRLPQISPNEIEVEWRAQIERFCTILGQPPDHLDSHHFVSYLSPEVFEIMLFLAQEYHCPIRFPQDLPLESVVSGLPPSFAEAFFQFSHNALSACPTRHPDRLLIDFFDAQATKEWLLELLRALQPGVTELMCHPGVVDSQLMARSGYGQSRQRELDILMDMEVKKTISELGIGLVDFSVLKQDRFRK